jgi:SAM-dependent methyltransferase
LTKNEIELIQERYARRGNRDLPSNTYICPYAYMSWQEIERHILCLFKKHGISISDVTLLEIGCGYGVNLLWLLRIGFLPQNLYGNELLDYRVKAALKSLPQGITFFQGDAMNIDENHRFDITPSDDSFYFYIKLRI